jgi:hypothetical protein
MGWLSAGLQLIGGIIGYKKGKKAEDAADAEAEKAARIDERVTAEKLANLKIEERQLAGQTRARAAGSGVKVDVGSPLDVLAEQAATFARERAVTREVGAEKAALTRLHGRNVGDMARYQGYGDAARGLSGAAGTLFSMFG